MEREERSAIVQECERLAIAYAHHVDFREYDKFVSLFSADGELNVFGRPLRGHEAIRHAMEQRPLDLRSRHVVTNVRIDVIDREKAEGTCYLMLYRAQTGDIDSATPVELAGPVAVGHYADSFVRTMSGWRFQNRKLHLAFRAPNAAV